MPPQGQMANVGETGAIKPRALILIVPWHSYLLAKLIDEPGEVLPKQRVYGVDVI